MSIESIRKRFEKELAQNPTLYHSIDIERVRNEDWQVKRFLDEFEGDEDKAFELLCKALRWKKEIGIHEHDDQYFPKEFWEFSGSEICGQDKNGRLIQLEVMRSQHIFKELISVHRQFLAHNMERIDRQAGEKGFVLVTDVKGAGVSNFDIDIFRTKIEFNQYFPGSLKQMLVVDLPWLLNPIMKIIVGLMNPKLKAILVYVKREQLLEYVEKDQIPVWLAGTREKSLMPENLIPLEKCYKKFDVNEKFVDYYYNFHKIKRSA
ncbi:Motile sperm domain-containing protein 2 [Sarcoptes scabiei]|uniref:Major sperm protein-like protein 2 n=1 Tax=Sarcoptes scabiei TaxID=52283 RepID=A0A132A6Z6_SARSC|nr:Motile sperm domain-containing protein 2 [Sarcoptes scabiei]KPM06659.1 major sperm protein-like protein 2 [Sarcoptes scabiei]UXI18036.1 Inactive phospholipase C-like protein 2 [Sarcoptes scabiei]